MALWNHPRTLPTEGGSLSVTRRIRTPLAALSFWSAIVFPVLYLALFVRGIETTTGLGVFLGLFGLHVLALIGGRNYHRSPE